MKSLYNIFIQLYTLIAWLLSHKNEKAKLWVEGRKNIFEQLTTALTNNQAPVIWVHCASLGEFEQGRPVIEALKSAYPQYKIVLTFFSPSGFEVQKNTSLVDWVFYLPMDGKKNAHQFYSIVQPKLVLFVKYEFWYYYLKAAEERAIPIILISGIFRNQQPFFKWYGNFHRKMLKSFTHFFVQNQTSKQLLNSINYNNVTLSGDTRFDRVIQIANTFSPLKEIEEFVGADKVLVVGSSWVEDDETLIHYLKNNKLIKSIIAPHNIDNERLKECLSLYQNSILYSDYIKNMPRSKTANCLIIDNIGMLSKLYSYATIAYIGGGFGKDGVHNVLEAAVFGKPVVFGPEYEKFIEAIELIEYQGAISIDSALSLEKVVNELLQEEAYLSETGKKAQAFVQQNGGATKKVMDFIYENRLLTN